MAPLVRGCLEARGLDATVEVVADDDTSGPAARLAAQATGRAPGVLGLLEPKGLAPEEARLVATQAARGARHVVVLAPPPAGRSRRSQPESWPLDELLAWRGFLAGLGLVPAPDLGTFIEAMILLQRSLPAATTARGAGGENALALPAPDDEPAEALRLGDRARALAALARTVSPSDPPPSSKEAQDRARFVLDRAGRVPGGHDAMLLLASYGIYVSRQAVVHSASAATRIADRIGYPVDVRAAIGGLHAEEQGAPLVSAVANAPGVRRAYTTVNVDQERLTGQAWEAAIVRERPPHGPRIRCSVHRHSRLGWLATVAPPPLCGEPRAAVAAIALPLSEKSSQRFASQREIAPLLPSGRFGAASAAGLADVLMRLSRLVIDHDDRLEEVAIEQLVCTVQRRAIAFEARIIRRW
jgi:hypothetical protein